MKVNTEDYVWAVASFILLGVSYHFGYLLYGILAVYVLMVVLFMEHIFKVKKRLSRSVAAYGTVTGYHEARSGGKYYYPILNYDTEDGRTVSSVYTVADRKQRYAEGSQELICYDPDDPIFFYFADRENEMTRDYYRYIFFGSIPALFVLIIILAN
ncbi:MAG: DUF3592 domain-containing protein [Ruminococcus sp.]|nr:DUF3592 domain-containing protein [Ruminococcus sp.]